MELVKPLFSGLGLEVILYIRWVMRNVHIRSVTGKQPIAPVRLVRRKGLIEIVKKEFQCLRQYLLPLLNQGGCRWGCAGHIEKVTTVPFASYRLPL